MATEAVPGLSARRRLLQRAPSTAQSALALAVAAAPLVVLRTGLEEFTLPKLTLLWVLGIIALAAWVAWAVETRQALPKIRIGYAAAAFLAASAVATVLSQSPRLSFIGLHGRYGGLVPLLLYAALLVVVVGLHWRNEELDWIPHHVTVASILLSLYIFVQASGHDWVHWHAGSSGPPLYPIGTLGNSSFAGSFLGIAVPFVLYVGLTARRPLWQRVLLAVLAMDLLALWLTQSRSGMVAAGAGLAAMAFAYRHRLPAWVTAATVAALALAAVVAVAVVWHPGLDRPPKALTSAQVLRTQSLEQDRFRLWHIAWDVFADHPVTGTGLDTFQLNLPAHRPPADGALVGFSADDKPHNIYLEHAADAGVLGLGTYLVLVGLVLWYGYRRARHIEGPARLLLVAFWAALIAYLAQGFFTIDAPPLPALAWLTMAGVTAMADPAVLRARARPEPSAPAPPRPWPLHAGVGVVALALLIVGIRPLLADLAAGSGKTEEAIELQPWEATYRSLAGARMEMRLPTVRSEPARRRVLRAATQRYGEALRLQPGNVQFMADVARMKTAWALTVDTTRFADADRWWARLVRRDPTNWLAHNQYASALLWWGDVTRDTSLERRAMAQFDLVARMGAHGPINGLATPTRVALARAEGLLRQPVPVTSGFRTRAQQQTLYAQRAKSPFLVVPPGTSAHERGLAIDVPQAFVPRLLQVSAQVGLCHPYPDTDPIHFEVCPPAPSDHPAPGGP